MASTPIRRGLPIGGLLVLLVGLCVWYGTLTPVPALGDYPSTATVTQSPAEYVGSQVSIGGTVVDTDPVTIAVDHDSTRYEFTVTHLTRTVDRGDSHRVFGTLTAPTRVRATKAVVTPPWGFTYMYVVSALAGVWVLARLAVGWRYDATRGLHRRTTAWRPLRQFRLDRTPPDTDESDQNA